ncbi:MAG: diaminopimelate decarboxylase family protein [Atopobiaceae bacterium]
MSTASTKRPFASAQQLQQLASQYPTPFHLYSEAEIRRRAQALLDAFAWNEGFREYFAVKATPNPAILQILKEYGCGTDCATGTELMLSAACGLRGHDAMFTSNDTPVADYRLARQLGAIINFDSYDQLDFWRQNLGEFPQTVCCRVNPGGTFEAANGIIGNPQDAKFGMTVAQLRQAFTELRDEGVQEFGIHAFLASNTLGNDYYPRLARQLFGLAAQLSGELGIHIGFVDLSGGIGVAYEPGQPQNDIAAIGEGVRQAYEEVLVPAGMGDLQIKTELGRWMTGPAGALVTRVIHEKVTYKDYLGVDACAANLMRPAMYGAYHHITVVGHEDEPATHTYNVVGGLCENNDQFAWDRQLPQVRVGDLLYIHDTGAHGYSMGYNYNGRLRSAEVLLRQDGTSQLIRRAETPADYFATLDVTPEGASLLQRLRG